MLKGERCIVGSMSIAMDAPGRKETCFNIYLTRYFRFTSSIDSICILLVEYEQNVKTSAISLGYRVAVRFKVMRGVTFQNDN